MPYKVLKPIPVNDGVIQPGEVVDAESWRNLRTLISGRYLAPDPVPASAATEAPAKPKAKRTTTPTSTDEE